MLEVALLVSLQANSIASATTSNNNGAEDRNLPQARILCTLRGIPRSRGNC